MTPTDLNKYLPGLRAHTINAHELKQGSTIVSVPLGATANLTVRTTVLPVGRNLTIKRVVLANRGPTPASAAGTILFTLGNRDASGGPADDNLISTANLNLESVPGADGLLVLTLTATAADLILVTGDNMWAQVVSNNVDAVGLDGLGLLVELTVDQP